VRRTVALVYRLVRAADVLAAILMALIALVLLAEVAARSLLAQSLNGSWEAAAMMMAAMFFLGLAGALADGAHVRVTLVSEKVPAAAARWLDRAATTIGLAIAAFATKALAGLALISFERDARSWELGLPNALPQATVALGMALLTLALAARLVRSFTPQEPPSGLTPERRPSGAPESPAG
jgi:TRAP-type C4-dicarboxylate transport system permease small subunit